jgi:hypothetical protein
MLRCRLVVGSRRDGHCGSLVCFRLLERLVVDGHMRKAEGSLCLESSMRRMREGTVEV